MKRLLCMILGHRWRTVRIEGQNAYECRRCKERDFEWPHGTELDEAKRSAMGGGGMSGGGGGG